MLHSVDHVRDVMVRKQNAHSILLEWSLPKKSEVSFYKVFICHVTDITVF